MSNTSGNTTTSAVTTYTHSTLDNFKDFNRTLSAKLDGHSDKLTSVVYDGKISLTVKMRLKSHYKQVTGDATNYDAAEAEHLKEFTLLLCHSTLAPFSQERYEVGPLFERCCGAEGPC